MSAGLPLNLDYIKTKPGMFKAIGVLVHLVAMSLIAAAYDTATYYKPCELPPPVFGYKFETSACDGYVENCKLNVDTWKSIVEKKKAIKEHPTYAQMVQVSKIDPDILDDLPETCPYAWIVTLPVILVILLWILSLLMLIVFLVIKPERYPALIKADFILHIVYAGGMALSSLLLICFLIWAFVGKYPCTERLYKHLDKLKDPRLQLIPVLFTLANRLGPPSTRSKSTNGEGRVLGYNQITGETYDSCFQESDAVYKLSLLVVGTILVVASTVLYGIVIYFLNKQSRVGAVGQLPASQDPQAQAQQPILSSQSSQQAYPQQAYPQQGYPQQGYPQQAYPQPLNHST